MRKVVICSPPTSTEEAVKKECPVCYAEVKKKLVRCFCGFEACVDCCKQWISGLAGLARCMSCKASWTDGFVANAMGPSYHSSNAEGGYRTHYKRYLVDSAKAQLDQIALAVGDLGAARKAYVNLKKYQSLSAELTEKLAASILRFKEANRASKETVSKKEKERLLAVKRECRDCNKKLRAELKELASTYPFEAYNEAMDAVEALTDPDKGEKVKSPKVLCACPYEDCTSLVIYLEGNWRCMIDASHVVCKDCHEPSGAVRPPSASQAKHRCDPQVVATIASFAKNTKPCPKCGARIFRAEGCTVMWCVQCHNGFDWNTGDHIPNEWVHNPHFTEWRAREGRAAVLNGCGERLTMAILPRLEGPAMIIARQLFFFYDLSLATSRHRNWLARDHAGRLNCISFNYLVGKIDEEQWRKRLFLASRSTERTKFKSEMAATAVEVLHQELIALADALKPLSQPEAFKVAPEGMPWEDEIETPRFVLKPGTETELRFAFLGTLHRLNEFRLYLNDTYVREGKVLGISEGVYIPECWTDGNVRQSAEETLEEWRQAVAELSK